MSRFLISALFLFFFTAVHPATSTHAQSALASKQQDNSPIEIVSDRMRSHNKGQKIVFSGNVEAKWGDLLIKSDILEVYNNSKKDNGGNKPAGEGKQQLDEVIAIGNVDITRGERRAKGDRAVYLDKLQRIILTGKPNATAWDGDNIIKGREMIFHLEDDRFTVNDRVRVTLFPEDDGKKNQPKPSPRRKN